MHTYMHGAELSVGNIIRRVLYIIRQECAAMAREEKTGDPQLGKSVSQSYLIIHNSYSYALTLILS